MDSVAISDFVRYRTLLCGDIVVRTSDYRSWLSHSTIPLWLSSTPLMVKRIEARREIYGQYKLRKPAFFIPLWP